MSYHLYQTRGFIVQSVNIGEANKLFFIFTESLGLIVVSAQSVRKTVSKLRYSLRDFSFARISFVRGKTSWRLTDAEEILSFSPKKENEKMKIFVGILSLVRRLVHGEEENNELFSILLSSLNILKNEISSPNEMRNLETLSVLKILASLGYIGKNEKLAPFLSRPVSKTLLDSFTPYRGEASEEINRAIEASQL